MIRLLSCCVLCCLLVEPVVAQRLSSIDSNKYRINLPDFWKSGHKIWRILTDKLPDVCDELKDKDVCGDDCNPSLRIEMAMTIPQIHEYRSYHISSNYTSNQRVTPSALWEIQTTYRFACYLLLMDQHDKVLTRFIIIDSNELQRVANRVQLKSYAPASVPGTYRRISATRTGVVTDPNLLVNLPPVVSNVQEGETPYAYINKNKEKLAPTLLDLFRVVDGKITSW